MTGLTLVRPRIVGFRARAQLGLVAPRSVSHQIDTNPGGVAVHYGGDPLTIRSHTVCEAIWRRWQQMHMEQPRGWNDIAYSGGFCQHGYAFAGRGLGVRTAAQGSNDGNDRFHAFVHLNDGRPPTTEALGALGWWVQQSRAAGSGLEVEPHFTFHPTSCPGQLLGEYAKLLDGKPLTGGTTAVPKQRAVVLATQRAVHVGVDGAWGPQTDRAVTAVRELRDGAGTEAQVRAAQAACGAHVDGAWGAQSKTSHARTVRALQTAWRALVPGLGVDGVWGPGTDAAWRTVRGALAGK